MPNHKKPSERIVDSSNKFFDVQEDRCSAYNCYCYTGILNIGGIISILDEMNEEIQSLQKEVGELKQTKKPDEREVLLEWVEKNWAMIPPHIKVLCNLSKPVREQETHILRMIRDQSESWLRNLKH